VTFLDYLRSIYGDIYGPDGLQVNPFQPRYGFNPGVGLNDPMSDRMTPRGPVTGTMPVQPPVRTGPVIGTMPVQPGLGRGRPIGGGPQLGLMPVNPGMGLGRGRQIGGRFENDGRLREPSDADVQRKLRAIGDPQMRDKMGR
jgi:hypothetical protein